VQDLNPSNVIQNLHQIFQTVKLLIEESADPDYVSDLSFEMLKNNFKEPSDHQILTSKNNVDFREISFLSHFDNGQWDRFKGSSDPSHFIFEINVGKRRIRHRTTLEFNFQIDSKSIEDAVIQIQSRSMSDPTLSDNDFKNKMAWI